MAQSDDWAFFMIHIEKVLIKGYNERYMISNIMRLQ